MEQITYQDLYRFHFLSDLLISPDGNHAIFTDNRPNREKNGYDSDLWLMELPAGTYRPLTRGGDAKGAFWLDDASVVFRAKRDKDGKETQWYRISIDGGEAEPFLSREEKVTTLLPLQDGGYAALLSRRCEGEEEEQPHTAKEGKDLWVFDEIPFWYDGQGKKNKIRNAIGLLHGEEMRLITPQYRNVTAMQLSPNGKKLAYAGTEFRDVLPRASGLFLYDLATGETETLVEQEAVSVGSLFFMGEDTLFYTGTTYEFPGRNPRYYLYDLQTGEHRLLPFCDASPSGSVGTDCGYGGGSTMAYAQDCLWFPQLHWGNAHLKKMDRDGRIETVCDTPGSFNSFGIHGDLVLMTAMRGTDLPEVWALDLRSGEERQLTRFNTEYLAAHHVVTPEYFTFRNRDGWELDGYVLKPVGYEAGRKYPAIFEMHGGPKGVYGGVFHHEMQCFANQGYFVFYTNPRGSDGRGEEFANITGQLGGIDYRDFMDFLDEVLRRYPDIDEARVGACGGSYAGFMCNWMIGHTNRFAAAASQRSISNYLTKSLCTDIGFNHNMSQLGTTPWEDFDTVWAHSPLKYAPQATTPTLFIHSDEDYRCWMSDAFQMFTALKMNGVDSRIALFHGESHGLSRIGKPENRIGRLTEIGSWFEKYLKP